MNVGRFNIDESVFIVAELGANHGGSIEVAFETIKVAKECGADAIKLQTFTPESMTVDVDSEIFMANPHGPWAGRKLYDLYRTARTPLEWHEKLFDYARSIGLEVFSTPFDKNMVDFLEQFNPCAYKVASFEITDLPLIRYIASKGKPVFISTGVALLGDIEEALGVCRREGNDSVVLLKCTSAYPAPVEDANLRVIPNLSKVFGCTVGLSDHTLGIAVPVAAVALGARVVEKHFILTKDINSPDRNFSLVPEEFKAMVDAIRVVEKALGNGFYTISGRSAQSRQYRRSLFSVRDIEKGEVITEYNVKSVRPGYGLPPKYLEDIVGKKARINIKKGTPIQWFHLE